MTPFRWNAALFRNNELQLVGFLFPRVSWNTAGNGTIRLSVALSREIKGDIKTQQASYLPGTLPQL